MDQLEAGAALLARRGDDPLERKTRKPVMQSREEIYRERAALLLAARDAGAHGMGPAQRR